MEKNMKKFEPFHCQMDYETNVVEVQFEGDFDEEIRPLSMLRSPIRASEGRPCISTRQKKSKDTQI